MWRSTCTSRRSRRRSRASAAKRRGPGRPRGSTTRRGPGRPPGSTTRRKSTNGRRQRSRRGGTRAEQALRVIRENPGITVSELGNKLNIKQKNYLYRVMNQLQSDGAVTKTGQGIHREVERRRR